MGADADADAEAKPQPQQVEPEQEQAPEQEQQPTLKNDRDVQAAEARLQAELRRHPNRVRLETSLAQVVAPDDSLVEFLLGEMAEVLPEDTFTTEALLH